MSRSSYIGYKIAFSKVTALGEFAKLLPAIGALFIGTAAVAEDRSCEISAVYNGTVSLLRDGAIITDPIGQLILQGDRFEKTSSAQILIVCSDQGEITIGASTEVDLGSLIEAPVGERRIFRVLRGISGFVMPAEAAPVDVLTLNAVASVRSTEWTVEVEEGETHVFVREGIVNVAGSGGASVDLTDGEGVTVMVDGVLGPVKSWGQGRIDAMSARLGNGWR